MVKTKVANKDGRKPLQPCGWRCKATRPGVVYSPRTAVLLIEKKGEWFHGTYFRSPQGEVRTRPTDPRKKKNPQQRGARQRQETFVRALPPPVAPRGVFSRPFVSLDFSTQPLSALLSPSCDSSFSTTPQRKARRSCAPSDQYIRPYSIQCLPRLPFLDSQPPGRDDPRGHKKSKMPG